VVSLDGEWEWRGARVWLLGLGTWVGLGLPLRWLDWLRVDGRDGRSMGGEVLRSHWLSHDQFILFSLVFRVWIDRNKLAGYGRSTCTSYSSVHGTPQPSPKNGRFTSIFSTGKNYTIASLC
jgi:hypothetical protein